MVKVIKEGVLHKGKMQKPGALLTLAAEDEARLVGEGYCKYAESWPAAKAEAPKAEASKAEAPKAEPAAEEGPATGMPEAEEPRPKRSRKR